MAPEIFKDDCPVQDPTTSALQPGIETKVLLSNAVRIYFTVIKANQRLSVGWTFKD